MKVGIMQPYFFPYIGYFQLINAVDEFVVYDNIEFTKKGWINRNRILVNGRPSYITIPLQKDSDYLDVKKRHLSGIWDKEKKKILNRISESYKKAPYFEEAYPVIDKCINVDETNLFEFILYSLKNINSYLNIDTPIIKSSTIPIDHSLKAEKKVISICKERKANKYFNPIGGLALYSKIRFHESNIQLSFLKTNNIKYDQGNNVFIPNLSIIDVLMNNSESEIINHLNSYKIV